MAHRDLKPENILCESADKVSFLLSVLLVIIEFIMAWLNKLEYEVKIINASF